MQHHGLAQDDAQPFLLFTFLLLLLAFLLLLTFLSTCLQLGNSLLWGRVVEFAERAIPARARPHVECTDLSILRKHQQASATIELTLQVAFDEGGKDEFNNNSPWLLK